MGLLAWVLVTPALAEADFRAWQVMYEGLVAQSLDGNLEGALATWLGLAPSLPATDLTRGATLFNAARVSFVLGDLETSRRSLREAATTPAAGEARALLGQIDEHQLRIRQLPVQQDFDFGTHAWLHSWRYDERGSIEAVALGTGERVLAWSTEVVDRNEDMIGMSFDVARPPTRLQLTMRASDFPALILPEIEDSAGRMYALPDAVTIPTDRWVTLDLAVDRFVSFETRGVVPPPRSPVDVLTFRVADITGHLGTDRGPNVIWIDSVTIR